MKNLLSILFTALLLSTLSSTAFAIQIHVDSHEFSQAAADQWADTYFSQIADGSFVNMSNGSDPNNVGTTYHISRDKTSTYFSLGRQLVFAYWIPNATASNLYYRMMSNVSATFMDKHFVDLGWERPILYDYAGGVIGFDSFYWIYPGTAEGFDLNLQLWDMHEASVTLKLSLDNQITSFTSIRHSAPPVSVPEPATAMLLGGGLAGLVFYRRRQKSCFNG